MVTLMGGLFIIMRKLLILMRRMDGGHDRNMKRRGAAQELDRWMDGVIKVKKLGLPALSEAMFVRME